MNAIYRGKIGHLPPSLREEVNQRLEAHEQGTTILAWLNSLPEVQAMLADKFNGLPINKQNLTKWRKFGFRDWLLHRQAQTMAAEVSKTSAIDSSSVTARLAVWGTFRYQMAVRQLLGTPSGGISHVNTLRNFANDLIALHRANQRAAVLQSKIGARPSPAAATSSTKSHPNHPNQLSSERVTHHASLLIAPITPVTLINPNEP